MLRLMFAGIKMSGVSTVSPGLSLIFPTVTSVMKSHLRVRKRIWSSPYLIVDFLPSLYYEQNTEHDTPYYNPIKTFDIVPAFEASHLLWRSYENSWEQIFSAGVGASWQKHYGTDVVTQLGYGQRISWNDVIDAGATLRWEKRPYDGDREHNLYVEFDMTFRF